ncbi:MAG: hypothetical protein OXH69_26320, partial [Acidobacteria bacterium]|nr:hypothetical protein [Acidobacteriota bacterium]
PEPAGPDPASVPGRADYEASRDVLGETHVRATVAAHAGWSAGVRDRAGQAGTPAKGAVEVGAGRARAAAEGQMAAGAAEREDRQGDTGDDVRAGQADVDAEIEKPLARHGMESVPGVGDWLAGKLFGTAENAAPDALQRADAPRRTDTAPDPDGQERS